MLFFIQNSIFIRKLKMSFVKQKFGIFLKKKNNDKIEFQINQNWVLQHCVCLLEKCGIHTDFHYERTSVLESQRLLLGLFIVCTLTVERCAIFHLFWYLPFFLQSIKEEWFKNSHYWKLGKWESWGLSNICLCQGSLSMIDLYQSW